MATMPLTTEQIDIGRILTRAFGAIGRNPALFIGIAVICLIIPSQAIRMLVMPTIVSGVAPNPLTMLPYTSTVALFGVVFNVIVQAMLTHATVTDLNGRRPLLSDCFKVAVPLILPLIGLGIVVTFGIGIGFALLFVPGVIVALMWSVAVPALVEERSGVFASLGRSRALTKGSRWRLFGLFLIAGILLYLPSGLISALAGGLQGTRLASPLSPAAILVGIVSGLAAMLLATIVAAAYVELRTVKEGATAETLAAIFD